MSRKIVVLELANGYVIDDANDPAFDAHVAKGVDEVLYQVRCLLTGEGISRESAPEAALEAPIPGSVAGRVERLEPGDMHAIRERIRQRVWARTAAQRGGA